MKKIILILILLIFITGCDEQKNLGKMNPFGIIKTEPMIVSISNETTSTNEIGRQRIVFPNAEQETETEEQIKCMEYCKEQPHIMCVGDWEITGEYPDCECKFICETEDVEEQPSDSSLIAHWTFDEDAKDSANDYDGTIRGSATFTTGKIGKALSFDGVDDYVELPQKAVSDIGSLTKGTIAFWFNYESLLDKQTIMPMFYVGVEEKEPDYMFIIEIGHFKDAFSGGGFPQRGAHPGPMNDPDPTNKKLYVTWVKDNKDPFLCYDSNVNLEENKWYHFAAVVGPDGNSGYLNGVEMGNRHYNFGSASNTYFLDDIQNKKKLMIGSGRSVHTFSPDFVYFKGALDDFRVYDRVLSSSEINELIE